MMVIFHFMFKMLKNPILKVELSRIYKNISTCKKCLILQNNITKIQKKNTRNFGFKKPILDKCKKNLLINLDKSF
jgi:hypothetical protein